MSNDPYVAAPGSFSVERVCAVRHFTDRLFSFKTTRAAAFRFRAGEFAMIGLMIDGKPLVRAYSMASPPWDDVLEFYSIKAPNGPLTSHLQQIQNGDPILIGKKTTGTLILDALTPGERLFLFATGTGFAPFASLLREPETHERYRQIIISHTCRLPAELDYGRELIAGLNEQLALLGLPPSDILYDPRTTQAPGENLGRVTNAINAGAAYADLSRARDRAMICGSIPFIGEMKALLEARGFREGAVSEPGDFVVERAFVG